MDQRYGTSDPTKRGIISYYYYDMALMAAYVPSARARIAVYKLFADRGL